MSFFRNSFIEKINTLY